MSDRSLIVGVDMGMRGVHLVRRQAGTTIAEWRRIDIPSHAGDAEGDALAARDAGLAMQDDPGWWDDVLLAGVEYPFAMKFSLGNKTILGAVMASIPDHVAALPLPADLWTRWFLRVHCGENLPTIPRKREERKPLIKARALHLLGVADGQWPQDFHDAFGISWAVEAYNLAGQQPATPRRPALRIAR